MNGVLAAPVANYIVDIIQIDIIEKIIEMTTITIKIQISAISTLLKGFEAPEFLRLRDTVEKYRLSLSV